MEETTKEYDAILTNWSFVKYFGYNVLMGHIKNDSKQRFRDGEFIRSSPVVEIPETPESGMVIQTRNTKYLIEGPMNPKRSDEDEGIVFLEQLKDLEEKGYKVTDVFF
jgi:hypothetical protein